MGRKLRSKAKTASNSLAMPPIKTSQQGTKQTQSIPLSPAGILPSVFDWTFPRAHCRTESYIPNGARKLADVNTVDLPAVCLRGLCWCAFPKTNPRPSLSHEGRLHSLQGKKKAP